jgi:hypothetical protein
MFKLKKNQFVGTLGIVDISIGYFGIDILGFPGFDKIDIKRVPSILKSCFTFSRKNQRAGWKAYVSKVLEDGVFFIGGNKNLQPVGAGVNLFVIQRHVNILFRNVFGRGGIGTRTVLRLQAKRENKGE